MVSTDANDAAADTTTPSTDELASLVANFHFVRNGNFDPNAQPEGTVRATLLQFWNRATPSLSAANKSTWFDRLWDAHMEKDRHYHTVVHLQEVLSFFDLLLQNAGLFSAPSTTTATTETLESSQQAIILATFFHDAVYSVHSGTNEEDSAKLFECFAQDVGLADVDPPLLQATVVDYILATKKHEVVATDNDANSTLARRLFLDLDMAVLGKDDVAYRQYAGLIRREYSHVPHDVYCEKRAHVLEAFLEHQTSIYGTQVMKQALEKQARANLTREVESLRNGIIPGDK